MTRQGVNKKDFNLVCDFPARESFRTSLLDRLKDIAAETESSNPLDQPGPKEIHLEDSDLDMLAAAEGTAKLPTNPFQ